ncbi:MAG: hypothetical protein ACI9CB_002732 [Rhodothermales bacterium]|jgi:hypothetical protein
MRPGRLFITFLFSGLAWNLACAQSTAPDYFIVPQSTPVAQSERGQSIGKESVPGSEYILSVGQSPSFDLEFVDVKDQTGTGFDHPQLGSERRAVAVATFARISQVLNGEPGSAKILIDSRSPWLNQNTLAVGIPFFQCVDGFQKPIIYDALRNKTHVHTHEGELLVNFDFPLSASLGSPPPHEYDLYTLLLHEITHILGFVGFTVEADGQPQDCGGARMLPAIAGFTRDASGKKMWSELEGQVEYVGNPLSLPTAQAPVSLDLPIDFATKIRLATSSLRVSGHWLPEDFVDRTGVLMLKEPFPAGQTRRNMTPESKSILENILGYQVNQELRGLTGSWIDSTLNGQGVTLHFIDESSFVIYFFGFGNNGSRQWMVGLYKGGFNLGESISIPLFEVSGGQFAPMGASNVEESPWGVLELRFLDCFTAQVSLNGLDGILDMTLSQLAHVDSLECY